MAAPPVVIETERTLLATAAGTAVRVRQVTRTVLAARLLLWLVHSQIEHMRQWSDERLKADLEGGAASTATPTNTDIASPLLGDPLEGQRGG